MNSLLNQEENHKEKTDENEFARDNCCHPRGGFVPGRRRFGTQGAASSGHCPGRQYGSRRRRDELEGPGSGRVGRRGNDRSAHKVREGGRD